jgi:hypothetical protein
MANRLSSGFGFEENDNEEHSLTHMPLEFMMRLNAAMMEALDSKTPDMPFTYTPLQGKEIRLLVLMVQGWTANEGEDDINCVLINAEPHLIPSYECLSYVWGPPSDNPSRVWCNGRSLPVTTKLLSALKCLRTGSEGPRFLWIEKGKQVQRMAEIYENADRVLLFPGLHPSFPPAIEFIYEFCGQFVRAYQDESRGSFSQHWLHYSADDLLHEYHIPLPDDDKWTTVRRLLSSPVFRRTWIVQELILAREVRIMINEQEYPFDMDSSIGFREFLGMHNQRSLSPVHGRYLGSESDDIMALLRARFIHRHMPGSSVRALLGVTDPRDKVYGILSIANDTKKLSILPDYSASTTACYVDTARKIITTTQSLDILLCKETLRQIDSLPTWAPDWSCSVLEKFGNYIGKDEKLYNVTKGTQNSGYKERISIQSLESLPGSSTTNSRA